VNPAQRHSTGPPGISPLAAGAIGLTVLAAVGLEAAVQAGAAIDHYQRRPPLNPLALVIELADHHTAGPPPRPRCSPPPQPPSASSPPPPW
jgi:hypothetical protein